MILIIIIIQIHCQQTLRYVCNNTNNNNNFEKYNDNHNGINAQNNNKSLLKISIGSVAGFESKILSVISCHHICNQLNTAIQKHLQYQLQ